VMGVNRMKMLLRLEWWASSQMKPSGDTVTDRADNS
jgi:hypothetical protein